MIFGQVVESWSMKFQLGNSLKKEKEEINCSSWTACVLYTIIGHLSVPSTYLGSTQIMPEKEAACVPNVTKAIYMNSSGRKNIDQHLK